MMQNKRQILLFLILFIVATLAVLPRALEPDADWASDEERWLPRSVRFLNALYTRDVALTTQSYHPGIITMWIGSLSLWSKYGPMMFMVNFNADSVTSTGGLTEDQLAILTPENLARARIGMAIFNTIIICVLFVLLLRFFGFAIAAISILLICYDPTFLAESRKVHVDAPLTGLMLLSVMFMLSFFESPHRKVFVILSGITFGAACLAKITGLVLLVYFPLVAMFYRSIPSDDNNRYSLGQLPYIISVFFLWMSSALLTVMIIWPAMWQTPVQLFGLQFPFAVLSLPIIVTLLLSSFQYLHRGEKTNYALQNIKVIAVQLIVFVAICIVYLLNDQARYIASHIRTALTQSHQFPQRYLGEVVLDPGKLYYFVMITIYSTPLTLISSLVGTIWACIKIKTSIHSKSLRGLFALAAFVGIYICYMSIAAKKLSRYLLPAYPVLAIITAITLIVFVLPWIRRMLQRLASGSWGQTTKLNFVVAMLVIVVGIGWQITSVGLLHPNYAAYINPLWGWSNITDITTIGRGVGVKKAAQYLNKLDGASDITVRASFICELSLPYYFVGRVAAIESTPSSQAKYDVLYVQDIQLGLVDPNLYENREPVKSIQVNGTTYVMIYKL